MRPSRRPLTDAERMDWVRLIRTENVGPITFKRLLEQFGTAGAAIDALPELARRGGRVKPLKPAPKAEAERELAALAALGAAALCACEPGYPPLLAEIDDAPPVLSLRGHAHLFERKAIAIVGARNASLNGRKLARMLAEGLAAAGYLVVSGLARGIDTAAHQGALNGGTVAVLAGGVDVVYPEENRGLYDAIVDTGVVVAECPPGTEPQARHFPRRNRIISGLSLGVVVVEAALRSGSLITARMALEQGREVLAVPGSPLDPRCQGANNLIRQGATLVESADDVIHAVATFMSGGVAERQGDLFDRPPSESPDPRILDQARPRVLESLSPTPVGVDDLIRDSGLPAPIVLAVLLELELAGRIERQAGNRVCRV